MPSHIIARLYIVNNCNCKKLNFPYSLSQRYLVTGGSGGISGDLASSELLYQDASQWVYAGSLPSARYGLRGATLDNKLIITGWLSTCGETDLQTITVYNHIRWQRWKLALCIF